MSTYMKTREIVVPTSHEAMLRLDYDMSEDNDLISYSLNDKEYTDLEKIEFFDKLNIALGLMIDDYEDEEILEEKLDLLELFMNNFMQQHPDHPILSDLNNVFKLAYIKKTGVFFFF